MKTTLLFIWQLPQHFLAFLVWYFLNLTNKLTKKKNFNGKSVYYLRPSNFGGVSLGNYIFLDERYHMRETYHEMGHSKQSEILGPFYLILVGIPSAFFNILTRMNLLSGETYYTRYPENWADDLGKVIR